MKKPKRFLFFNGDLCLGCHACEVACKEEHNLPTGVNRARIITEGPALVNGKLELKFHRIRCLHCSNPPCIEACPTGAIQQRPDGIAHIEEFLCTGCRSCAAVCPQRAIEFHPESSVAQICDMCAHRLDKGLFPFCLKHCMGGALFYGTEEEFEQEKSKAEKAKGGKNG